MSSSGLPVEYAAWAQPGTSFTVAYSLPLFHEIDFFVNEGYRRIPHGGIELGGLLFGSAGSNGIRIETFQPIECEHASGPSFKLSERDIAALRKQIEAGDAGVQVLGWFVAHTRSELQMNDMEAALFDELLPGPEKVMLLVKPEKFKSTRFAFQVRGAAGSIQRDGTQQAFVLPLPGRAGRVDPARVVVAESIAPAVEEAPIAKAPEVLPPNAAPAPPIPATEREFPFGAPETESRIERRRLARAAQRESSRSKFGFVLILLLAGLLGCGIGYWTYLQLPSAVIPVDLQPTPDGLTFSWPPELTGDSVYVAVRINDSEPVLISARDRSAGHFEIRTTGDNVKVELIVRRWMRDSRGIARYVR